MARHLSVILECDVPMMTPEEKLRLAWELLNGLDRNAQVAVHDDLGLLICGAGEPPSSEAETDALRMLESLGPVNTRLQPKDGSEVIHLFESPECVHHSRKKKRRTPSPFAWACLGALTLALVANLRVSFTVPNWTTPAFEARLTRQVAKIKRQADAAVILANSANKNAESARRSAKYSPILPDPRLFGGTK